MIEESPYFIQRVVQVLVFKSRVFESFQKILRVVQSFAEELKIVIRQLNINHDLSKQFTKTRGAIV
jgi:hypothetical protein